MTVMKTSRGYNRRRHSLKVRAEQLPLAWRTALEGIERYLAATGPADDEGLARTLEGLIDRFEGAFADGSTIAEVVGDDPVSFAEELKCWIGHGPWLADEQLHLRAALEEAELEQGS